MRLFFVDEGRWQIVCQIQEGGWTGLAKKCGGGVCDVEILMYLMYL